MPDFSRFFLLVLAAACLALALLLRRRRERLTPRLWIAVELAPVFLTWTASSLAVWLFAYLAPFVPKGNFHGLAVASGAVPALLVALSPPSLRARAAGFAVAAFGLLLLADLAYFRFFGGVVPLLAFGSAVHLWDVRDSVGALLEGGDAWLLPLLVLASALLVLWPRRPAAAQSQRWIRLASWALAVGACVGGTIPVWQDVKGYTAVSRSWKVMSILDNLKSAGIVVAHARDVAIAWRERQVATKLGEKERADVWRYVDEHGERAQRHKEADSFGALEGHNVIFVQMEAIQELLVDAEVRGEPVMPFLRSLRDRGLYFPNVYDQTGGSPTSDCEYLVLNGLHPLARGAVSFRRAGNDFIALPNVLRERGYETVSAHAYHRGMWNRGILHPKWGFSSSHFKEEMPAVKQMGWGIGDKPFFGHAVELAKQQKQPFFQFLITLTSHHPYKYIPKSEWSLGMKGVPAPLSSYLRSARYVDEALAELVDGLRKAGLSRNTVLVIYGDHDAKLKYSKAVAKRAAKHMNLDVLTLQRLGRRDWAVDRVPLLIVPPEGSDLAPDVVPTVGGQIDIGPTVLHYLGVDAPSSFLGLPLIAERDGWVGRFDGAGADATRLVRPGKKKPSCHAAPGSEDGAKPKCGDLIKRVDAQTDVSALVTIHNLAAQLASAADEPGGAP